MRLLELYTSVQGEGPRTGMPITFVRFAGCNMRCPGWPCDTQHAIEPSRYAGQFDNLDPEEVIERLPAYPKRICVTGGEPFLQKGMHEFLFLAVDAEYEVDVFTNGSFEYHDDLFQIPDIRLVMDWKLTGSGEHDTARLTRVVNAQKLRPSDSIKFVVKDLPDLREAEFVHRNLLTLDVRAEFWVGAAWGHIPDAEIVEFVLEQRLPWRLNVQMHNHIWDPQEKLR